VGKGESGEEFYVVRTCVTGKGGFWVEPAGYFSITENRNLTRATAPTFCRRFHAYINPD
jgi:hypothetical protein